MKLPNTNEKLQALVGRKIYFRMNKEDMKKARVLHLTPRKSYVIKSILPTATSMAGAYIIDDKGYSTQTLIGSCTCAFLGNKTKWILAHKTKADKRNALELLREENS